MKTSKITLKERYTLDDLILVMSALRDPESGCPWDLEQNFKSIVPYTIEESYEVADAIDRNDMTALREELGDLLLQPIYHAQMASEKKIFCIQDVIHDVTEKMISRHPHVFGEDVALCAQDVNKIWDMRKDLEKNSSQDKSALDGVTRALPSLLRAQKLQKKAAKVGFEWTDTTSVMNKFQEELAELEEAMVSGDPVSMQEEFGDVLFVLSNLGRLLGIDAEEALRNCNTKFERRFRGLESEFKDNGQLLKDVTLEDMIESWNRQKVKEKKAN